MIKNSFKKPIPYKSVVADLVNRNGAPGEHNYPFNGMMSHLEYKAGRYRGRFPLILEYLSRKSNDIDHRVITQKKSKIHYNCISEVPEEYVYQYIEQLMYDVTRYDRDGLREHDRYSGYMQRILVDEEGEETLESELLNSTHSNRIEELAQYRKKLPYLLQRLHQKSCETKIHVLSAIIARERCLKAKETLKPNNLLSKGIYYADANGNPIHRVVYNDGIFGDHFCRWLLGDVRMRDKYYEDLVEFIFICGELEIDLASDDPKIYDANFINSLVCDYVIENSQLYLNVAYNNQSLGNLSQKEKEIIRNISLDDLENIEQIVRKSRAEEGKGLGSPASQAMDKFEASRLMTTLSTRSSATPRELIQFRILYNTVRSYSNEFPLPNNTQIIRGFFHDLKGNPIILHMQNIIGSKPIGVFKGILHRTGTLVMISDTPTKGFFYMEKGYLLDRMNSYVLHLERGNLSDFDSKWSHSSKA